MSTSHDDRSGAGHEHGSQYRANSLSLIGAVAMGTGVMIGAGVFALTGQIAEQAGGLFPYAFLAAALVTGFSAYSYVKMSNAYPSAGGIAMYLEKAYGKGVMTAGCALLMYFSMVINESLVARTFGTYTLQMFDVGKNSWLVPALGVGLLAFAFIVNISGNRFIGTFSMVMAILKIVGIAAFAIVGLWVADFSPEGLASTTEASGGGFIASIALGILAYKGFTTITNSGGELKDPHRNVSRAIIISILICVVLYVLMAWAVASALSIDQIIEAKDYALAEAARPAVGRYGVWFTVGLAIVACDAHRHETRPAQPFRDARSNPETHPCLHHRDRDGVDDLLRPQPHRFLGRDLLHRHGPRRALGCASSSKKGCAGQRRDPDRSDRAGRGRAWCVLDH